MEKKKILYVITKGNFGGAQRYVFDLATHISKDQFDVVVAFGEGKTLGEKLSEANVRTITIKSLKRDVGVFSDIAAFFSLLRVIREEKPHVLHLNSSKIGVLGAIAGRILGVKKIIFTGHGWAFNEERSLFVKLILYMLYWFVVLLSHNTIAVSERTADQISWMPFIKKKIFVVHNGIESFKTLPQHEARTVLSPATTERTWIGTISELHKSKGLDYLMRAFALVAEKYVNTALIIVGNGEEEAPLKALSGELGLDRRVIFTGFVPDARTYLKAFDIFTLTSRTEAFPYVPLEAGFVSLPVVASWVGGIPEIIVNEESGLLVDSANTQKLADSLERLITDGELRTHLGTSLHETVTESFMLQNMVQKTILLY